MLDNRNLTATGNVWLRFGVENRVTGYQSILDALLEPSDDGFLGCLHNLAR
jgi:hypothetical protein